MIIGKSCNADTGLFLFVALTYGIIIPCRRIARVLIVVGLRAQDLMLRRDDIVELF